MVQCFFALFLFPLLIQSSEYQFILPTQISSNIQDNGTQENLLFKEKNSVYTYIKKSTGGWIETPFSNWSAAFHYDLKDDFLFGIWQIGNENLSSFQRRTKRLGGKE